MLESLDTTALSSLLRSLHTLPKAEKQALLDELEALQQKKAIKAARDDFLQFCARLYPDWKDDKQFILDVMEMLDNVLQYFIDKAPSTIARAKYSAMMERSIGVGTLGFHAFLQTQHHYL